MTITSEKQNTKCIIQSCDEEYLMLSDRADSRGSVYGIRMADANLTGSMLLSDCNRLRLSLQASTSAEERTSNTLQRFFSEYQTSYHSPALCQYLDVL